MACRFALLIASIFGMTAPLLAEEPVIRIGIIGCDTSHAIAFTQIINNPDATGDLAAVQVVAAYPGGSEDIPSSRDRVPEYVKQLREQFQVEIVDTIPALLEKVDVVMIESVDGRPHLEQARPVFEAKKPLFIDKPLAGSLADAIAIAELGREHNVPWFSSSALRFSPTIRGARRDEKIGEIRGALAWSPSPIEATHPDLFWYGIHGVETLFTLMGPGCETVTRTHTAGADVVTGVWADGRIGTFRGIRDGKGEYGSIVFGTAGIVQTGGFAGYEPLVEQIATFFRTKVPPVAPEETIEIIAFMEAADESKRQNGAPVKMADVVAKARDAQTKQ